MAAKLYKTQPHAAELDRYTMERADLDYLQLDDDASDQDVIAALAGAYWTEIGSWREQQNATRAEAVREWLQGLPGALAIEYTYNGIAEWLRAHDVRAMRPRQHAGIADLQDRQYWRPLAARLSVQFTRVYTGRNKTTDNRGE